MPANKEILQKRYARIKNKFDKMSAALTPTGRRKYTYTSIIESLADEFCYSQKTIENICTGKRGAQ